MHRANNPVMLKKTSVTETAARSGLSEFTPWAGMTADSEATREDSTGGFARLALVRAKRKPLS